MPQNNNNVTLTSEDINFLHFNLNEHINLLEERHGVPFENTIAAEKERGEAVFRKVIIANKLHCKIKKDDFYFIEFALEERGDFIAEGIGRVSQPGAGHLAEAARCTWLLKKLRRWCGIREAEDDETTGPALSSSKEVRNSKPQRQTQSTSSWDWREKFEQISFF